MVRRLAHMGEETLYKIFVANLKEGAHMRDQAKLQDNIKMYFKGIGWQIVT